MTQLNVDVITGRDGQAAPEFTKGLVVTGIVTATTLNQSASGDLTVGRNIKATGITTSTGGFVGAVTGNVTGNLTGDVTGNTSGTAGGLTGTPNIVVGSVTGTNATFSGNLTVQGTQTVLNTETLDVADKTVGIGSTSNASNTTADNAGIVVYGSTDGSNDKTLTWTKDTGNFRFNQPLTVKGVTETVAAASTHESGVASKFVLELDLASATTFKYTLPALGNIGIVSFKNMPADNVNANGVTATVIFTQASSTPAGFGNTTAATGIGTYCKISPWTNGTRTGISTRGKVGSASTVTLSLTKDDVDFVSFFVDYNGSTNTVASSYKVYVTKNGNFRQGTVGI